MIIYYNMFSGDKNNYKYGSLYAYDVPTYKTVIKHCIGEKLTASLKSQLRNPNNHDTSLRWRNWDIWFNFHFFVGYIDILSKNISYSSNLTGSIASYPKSPNECSNITNFSNISLAPFHHSRYYSKLKAPELSLHYSSKFLRLDADYISLTVSSQCWEPSEPVLAALDPSKSDPNSKEKWILFIDSTGKYITII